MPTGHHRSQLATILRQLNIAVGNPTEAQIRQFLMYCNHDRLMVSVLQIGQQRQAAERERARGATLTSLQQALLDPTRIWGVARDDYNQQLRNYGFLYVAFNLLEDSLRRAVDVHYCAVYGETWFKDATKYPPNFQPTSRHPDELRRRKKLNALTSCATGHDLGKELSLGDVVALIYDPAAWTVHGTRALFASCANPDNPSATLPELTQCDVYEKLSILQWRRNDVYHHNVIGKTYTIPPRNGCVPPQRNDGRFNNTRDRIYEVMRYLGLRPEMVMTRIVGDAMSLMTPP